MPNVGGWEVIVVLLVALIVLGPTKLPQAIRQIGRAVGEIRRIGAGFRQELSDAAAPVTEAVATVRAANPAKAVTKAVTAPFLEAHSEPSEINSPDEPRHRTAAAAPNTAHVPAAPSAPAPTVPNTAHAPTAPSAPNDALVSDAADDAATARRREAAELADEAESCDAAESSSVVG